MSLLQILLTRWQWLCPFTTTRKIMAVVILVSHNVLVIRSVFDHSFSLLSGQNLKNLVRAAVYLYYFLFIYLSITARKNISLKE